MSSKKVSVSATQGRAFFALLSFSRETLYGRPVSVVAEHLGIDLSGAQRHVSALKKAGLVKSAGRYGLKINVPSGGWIYHRHSPNETCLGEPRMVAEGDQMIQEIAGGGAGCTRCKQEAVMADKAVVEKLRGVVHIHERRRGRPSTASDRKARLLMAAYVKERRKHTPGYHATRGGLQKAKKAVARLSLRMVDQDLYRAYVAYAFETYERMLKDKYDGTPVPAPAFLTSETIIDNFTATLGRRELNVEKAQEMLQKAKNKADPGIAVTIARNKLEGLAEIPDSLDDELRDAIELIIENITEIGYRAQT